MSNISTMIKVTDVISGQSFESIRLASQYFNIQRSIVTRSIKKNEVIEINNKKFKFVLRKGDMKSTTTIANAMRRFPFGKYKNQLIRKCIDVTYMRKLMYRNNVDQRMRWLMKSRINELKQTI